MVPKPALTRCTAAASSWGVSFALLAAVHKHRKLTEVRHHDGRHWQMSSYWGVRYVAVDGGAGCDGG